MEQNLKTETKSYMRVFVYAMYITKVEISQPWKYFPLGTLRSGGML